MKRSIVLLCFFSLLLLFTNTLARKGPEGYWKKTDCQHEVIEEKPVSSDIKPGLGSWIVDREIKSTGFGDIKPDLGFRVYDRQTKRGKKTGKASHEKSFIKGFQPDRKFEPVPNLSVYSDEVKPDIKPGLGSWIVDRETKPKGFRDIKPDLGFRVYDRQTKPDKETGKASHEKSFIKGFEPDRKFEPVPNLSVYNDEVKPVHEKSLGLGI